MAEQQQPTKDRDEHRELVIVGSGPAGFTAAIYAARAGLEPLMLRGAQPGGQLTTTTEVENYPGFPDGVTGAELMELFERQAMRFGADARWGTVTAVDLDGPPFRLTIDDKKVVRADAVIVSTGASARYLGLDNEKRLLGRGVSACATCDGAFFRDDEVAIVGGGDTAMEEALFLTRFASKVYVVHRRDQLRASKILQQRVLDHPKIEVLWNRRLVDVLGDNSVCGAVFEETTTGERSSLAVTGVFIAIGHKPNTELFKPWLATDANGYLVTAGKSSRTSREGVFACGDVQDSIYRQAITAAGSGSQAAIDAERWLEARRYAEQSEQRQASRAA